MHVLLFRMTEMISSINKRVTKNIYFYKNVNIIRYEVLYNKLNLSNVNFTKKGKKTKITKIMFFLVTMLNTLQRSC